MNWRDKIARAFSSVCKFTPKDDSKIIFYSTGEYPANLLTLYRNMDAMRLTDSFEVIWVEPSTSLAKLLESRGIRVYPSRERQTVKSLCSAKFIVSSHGMPLIKSSSQIGIELWHGIPLKSIGFFNHNDDWSKLRIRSKLLDYLITTSPFTRILFSSFLGVCPDRILDFGSPATDALFNPLKSGKSLLKNVILDFNHVYFYLPTYRDHDRTYSLSIIKEFLTNAELLSFLESTNSLLLIKPHPWDEAYVHKIMTTISNFKQNIQLLPNKLLWSTLMTIYDVLAFVDVLITDYSSIYFDYLLLNRPIVFYVPDLERYKETRGFLLEPYEKWTPGDKARTIPGLIQALQEAIDNPDKWKREREWLRDVMFKYQDGKASERIIKYFWG